MEALAQHIKKITGNHNADTAGILSCFTQRPFRKKEILQEEGKRCLHYYFVVKGCLRLYFTDHNGIEQ